MSADFDARLTELAAEILRDAAQVYSLGGAAAYSPVLAGWSSGMFGRLQMTSSFQALTGSFQALGQDQKAASQASLKQLFGLPRKLPAIRLPTDDELAATARSAPIVLHLEALARWLGRHGRRVTAEDLLSAADAADAARSIGIDRGDLPYLWEYALVSGWVEMADELGGGQTWAVQGPTAYRWADGDVPGTLHAWAAVFAAVLAVTLETAAAQAPTPDAVSRLSFRGQGVALAVMLFLARRTGLTIDNASDIVRDGAIGDTPTARAKREWNGWVHRFGDPARLLLRQLADLHAVTVAAGGKEVIALTSLAQWALREQFGLDKINVPVVRASAHLSVADLLGLADGITDDEFETAFTAWLGQREPGTAAQELLLYAGSASPQARLAAVGLVRRLGRSAVPALMDAMKRSELRGYARLALSTPADARLETSMPPILNPEPADMGGVAADLLALIGEEGDPDAIQIKELLVKVVPEGEEAWFVGTLAGGHDPAVVRLLGLVGRYHPDRRLAKSARKGARAAAKNQSAIAGDRVLSRAGR